MKASELMALENGAATPLSGSITFIAEGSYPFYDISTKKVGFAYAKVWDVTSSSGGHHTVVLGCKGYDDYHIWCGDTFLEGKITSSEADNRITEACDEVAPVMRSQVEAELKSMNGIAKANAKCGFWGQWRGEHKLCKHSFAIKETEVNMKMLDNMYSAYQDRVEGKSSAVSKPATIAVDFMAKLAFRTPVLIEGERGSGKTHTARAYALDNAIHLIEVDGHEGVESHDLLGFFVPNGKGGLIWKDGGLTEAFRKAKSSKVVLLVDEILRIPQRPLSVFLSALSPFQGSYRLRTGRMTSSSEGVGVEETIEVPCENLFVVATTNVGSQYAVDSIDPALAERFVVIRKDTDIVSLKSILTQKVTDKGFSSGTVDKLVKFWDKMEELKRQGMVNQAPTIRTLSRAVELADTEDGIKQTLDLQILLWVSRDIDGFPVQEQVDVVKALISKCF